MLGCKCKGIGTCRFGHAWAGRELVLSASVKTSLCACATFVLTCLPTSMEHPVQNPVDRAARLQSAAPGGRAAAAVGEGDGKPRPLSCAPKRLTRPPGTLFMQADVASTLARQAACLSPSLPSKGLQWHALLPKKQSAECSRASFSTHTRSPTHTLATLTAAPQNDGQAAKPVASRMGMASALITRPRAPSPEVSVALGAGQQGHAAGAAAQGKSPARATSDSGGDGGGKHGGGVRFQHSSQPR